MSPASFWDQNSLAPKQLPTLQELVRCCDETLLLRVVLEDHVMRAEGVPPSSKRRRAMEKRLSATLRSMRALSIKKKVGRRFLLIPEESFVLHTGTLGIERRLAASLVSFDDLHQLARSGKGEVDHAAGSPQSYLRTETHDDVPKRYPYALIPWEQTLACRVWLGGPWCRRERYIVIASAIWEMTFYGFEYERVVACQAQTRARTLLGEVPGDTPSSLSSQGGSAERVPSFDLEEPDRFDADYRESLAVRTAELNCIACTEFQQRCIDVIQRMDLC